MGFYLKQGLFIGTSRGGLILHIMAALRPDLIAATVLNDIGPEIEAGFDNFLRVTFPLIQLTGSSPKVAIGATPEQPIPYRVIDNLTDPLWKIEYQNTDTTV